MANDFKNIYLDNAASTPLSDVAFEAMLPFLKEHYGNPSSVHAYGRILRAAIEKARKSVAAILGAAPAEIFFTSGGTEADNTAIRGAVSQYGIRHIITTRLEHHAVLHEVEELEKKGLNVTWLETDSTGSPDMKALEKALSKERSSLVTLMHANNELGTMIDFETVAELCKHAGAMFQSDTVQSLTHYKYDLGKTPVQFIAASAHKFYGPNGVGFLYIKSGTKIPPVIAGGSQERNMRAGTENTAAIVGLAAALEDFYQHYDEKNGHLQMLKDRMWDKLSTGISGMQINGTLDKSKAIPTVLNVAFPSEELESMLLFNLDINGIAASGGSACTSGSVKGSHVLQAMGYPDARIANSVRFSFGCQNTIEEIDYATDKILSFTRGKIHSK